jgi:protein-L-isoaspartate(D-aspartate) O-methyltransferase
VDREALLVELTAADEWTRRKTMVEEQIVRRGVKDESVLSAMRTVPRHLFVAPEHRDRATEDRPLDIGHGQTISQPYIVAVITEAVGVSAGDRVLEIGTGCGYQAAVLAEVASEVYTIERIPALSEEAGKRLRALHYGGIQLRAADGALGWPEAAPFDGIVLSCGTPEIPPALIDQLRPGRRLVAPVGPPGGVMDLVLIEKKNSGGITRRILMPVRFVPLVGASAGDA